MRLRGCAAPLCRPPPLQDRLSPCRCCHRNAPGARVAARPGSARCLFRRAQRRPSRQPLGNIAPGVRPQHPLQQLRPVTVTAAGSQPLGGLGLEPARRPWTFPRHPIGPQASASRRAAPPLTFCTYLPKPWTFRQPAGGDCRVRARHGCCPAALRPDLEIAMPSFRRSGHGGDSSRFKFPSRARNRSKGCNLKAYESELLPAAAGPGACQPERSRGRHLRPQLPVSS